MFISEFSTVGRESKRRQAPREVQTSRTSRCRRYLVQRGACAGTATAGRIVVDYAVLIGAEHALPRRPNCLGSPGDQIADRRNEAITSQRKGVAAFRPLSEDVIQQARLGGGGGTRICPAHGRQGNWVAEIRIGQGIGQGGGVDQANGRDGRGFIGAQAGAEKVGNRDRRNDQNDRDNQQQLDQREPVAVFHGYPRSRQLPGCSTASSRRWETTLGSIVRIHAEIAKKDNAPGQNLKGGFNVCPEDYPACRERRFVR